MTATPTFDDEFDTLSLWNGTTGTWQPSYFWSPDGYITSGMSSWLVNPAYGPTSEVDADVYSVNGGVLNMGIIPTPADVPLAAVGNAQFLSGMLTTYNSFSQLYGYFEINAELPVGAGTSAAFWLLPESGAWPPELDVFEVDGSQGANAADFGVFTRQSGSTQQINTWNYNLPNLSTSFNTFAVDWTASTITWYVDGQQVYQIATPADMHSPMYMLLDDMTDSSGSWNGTPTSGETGDMQVNWVRVYASDPYTSGTTSTSTSGTPSTTGSGSTSTGSTGSTGSTSTGSTGSTSTGGTSTSVPPSPDPAVTVPTAISVSADGTIAITGAEVTDAWAETNPGTLALDVTASAGSVAMTGSDGATVSGSGTAAVSVTGTLAQINGALTTLAYTAGGTNGSVTVDVWDQAGTEASGAVAVTVTGGPSNGLDTTGDATTQAITVAATDLSPVELVSNASISAIAGDHLLFIGGSGNVATLTGGTETVQAFQGGNTITTGSGNDMIQIAGRGSVVNAGAGDNTIEDSGSDNTIVLPTAGNGYDTIYGYVIANDDTFDMRALLGATAWNGTQSTIGDFVQMTVSGINAVIDVTPTGSASGGSYAVAMLEGSGAVSLQTLLAHAITS